MAYLSLFLVGLQVPILYDISEHITPKISVGMVTVSQDGTGNFTKIIDAVNFAPANLKPNDGYFVIYVKRGTYKEYVTIPSNKTNIFLRGDGIDETIITGNRSPSSGYTTSTCGTFIVIGERFVGIDITFENTRGQGEQAVAVMNESNQSAFYRCSFKGYQDTLYAKMGFQFYRECLIYGTVDFICGDASAVFQNSRILGHRPVHSTVVISAQQRNDPNGPGGYAFHNCSIDAAENGVEKGSVFLGRPWGNFSRVVYIQCHMSDIIHPAGWTDWDGDHYYRRNKVYYGEYRNNNDVTGRTNWKGVHSSLQKFNYLRLLG